MNKVDTKHRITSNTSNRIILKLKQLLTTAIIHRYFRTPLKFPTFK